MTLGIFIFRRDLRVFDNTALIAALKSCDKVLPIFIFDPVQVSSKNNYKSDNSIQFMIESLEDLDEQLDKSLHIFHGFVEDVLRNLFNQYKEEDIELFVNMDYTPYSTKRDKMMQKLCEDYSVKFNTYEDIKLLPIDKVKTSAGGIYTKFTPFFRTALKFHINKPVSNNYKNYYKGKVESRYLIDFKKAWKLIKEKNENINVNGGRTNGLKILKHISEYDKYNKQRNYPAISTTNLSAYNKFGCVSIREVYWTFRDKLGMRNELVKQLYWRDFYYNIVYYHPNVVGNAFQEKYNKLKWDNKYFTEWKNGLTGFPIVDAGMRQLNTTGFMHNRCRMIVASFLVKDLHVDWKKGEKYFSQNLVDIDLAQNNGGWQWSAGTGSDIQPYFRIFNPWLQSKKYDAECEYIKRWIPELKEVPNKHIHEWYKYGKEWKVKYPLPIINHDDEKRKTLKYYKSV